MEKQWKAENIRWSIYSDTSGEYDDWIKENKVDFVQDGRTWIAAIPDGIYMVGQVDGHTSLRLGFNVLARLKTKVSIVDGRVDIQSCKEAVAEFLNKTGDGHYFIEKVHFNPKRKTVEFSLGS